MPQALPYPVRALLDLLFPARCQSCGRFGPELLCADCRSALRPISPPFCLRCGLPFDPLAKGGELCAGCRGRSRWPYRWARSAAYYQGPLREAIINFKFHRRRVLAGPLAELMLAAVERWQAAWLPESEPDHWEVLCPVPLHPWREQARGFNQCELLCRRLGEAWGLPVEKLLVRSRETQPQVDLPGEARRGNVRGAFVPASEGRVQGRSILVVDDLWTTGSTLVECARALRGAEAVYLFSLARPPREQASPGAAVDRARAGSV